jgi:hypothetical protein
MPPPAIRRRRVFEAELSKSWRARRATTAITAKMHFSDAGLVLGADTVLAKSDGDGRMGPLDEARLAALLAAAHLSRPTALGMAHTRRRGWIAAIAFRETPSSPK